VEELEVMQLKIKNKSELPAMSIHVNHTGKRGLFTDGLCHTFQEGTECKK